MIDQLPLYVSIVFILTTLLTVWLFLRSIPRSVGDKLLSRLLTFLLPFWLLLQGVLGMGDFYHKTDAVPPRVFTFGVLPVLLLIALYFVFFRKAFVENLSLKALALVHIVRIPVELVLLLLFQAGQVPQLMTFEGRNFDILSGLTAPIVYFLAFRGDKPNRPLLIVWNLAALVLLINIMAIAVLSFKSPLQKLAFDQPNVGVTYFPFIWLPAVVVPIVFFAHLASLWKLFKGSPS
jgi:hypothetical protein